MLLPQPLVMIVNNAAAGGTAGTRTVRDAEADGYTIGMFHMGLLTAPAMGVVDYDHTAFEMIGQVGRTPIGLGVTASSRFKSIQDLIAEAKAKPDTITVAMNIGLLPHFVPLMFQQDAGIRLRYAVGWRSGAAEVTPGQSHRGLALRELGVRALRAGHQAAGNVENRVPDLPDVPTAREIGINTVFEERVMAFAPKGTPRDRLDVVAKALQSALDDPEVVTQLAALEMSASSSTARSFARPSTR